MGVALGSMVLVDVAGVWPGVGGFGMTGKVYRTTLLANEAAMFHRINDRSRRNPTGLIAYLNNTRSTTEGDTGDALSGGNMMLDVRAG
jgi:hypothetical protein